jgi:hypothetical protein
MQKFLNKIYKWISQKYCMHLWLNEKTLCEAKNIFKTWRRCAVLMKTNTIVKEFQYKIAFKT